MLTLHLVRHAPTLPNAQRRYPREGEDAPLSGLGRELAASLRLPPDALALTSPSLRARETAALAGFPQATRVPDLAEAHFGVMSGRTWAELEAEFGEAPRGWIESLADPAGDRGPPGGETGRGFHGRIGRWLETLPDTAEVVAFTHAGVILAALRLTVGLRAVEVRPGGIATLSRAGEDWWLTRLTAPG
ncbi:histidine phosphatase family protein [Deinococcus apachensis]|uniref:histidine phosphatase family protein n=1 Tax=Deinococcus apachensis TaxID=309886 RepID=UPI0003A67C5B|nr:histidine phosphatase family protein [Deinococcus apachensis]